MLLLGFLVPYDSPSMGQGRSAHYSPIVIAIKNASINGLPSVMKVFIIIAVSLVDNSFVFGSSRPLATLVAASQAPEIFNYFNKYERKTFV